MKYMLLIHQGTTPLPGTDEWNALSQEEQGKVYAAYQALNQTPGVTPGRGMDDRRRPRRPCASRTAAR